MKKQKARRQGAEISPGYTREQGEEFAGYDQGMDSMRVVADLCPALAARKRPKPRRGLKKKIENEEYYDFATALLAIEVQTSKEPASDPFMDARDFSLSSLSSSRASPRITKHTPRKGFSLNPGRPQPHASARNENDAAVSPLSNPNRPLSASPPFPSVQAEQLSTASSQASAFERPSKEGTAFRNLLISHAKAHFTRQHRTCLFQLVLLDSDARFIRWDRAGAVVSVRFDFIEEPQYLAEFLWRFEHMTDEQRGLDPTVSPANKREAALFRDAVQEFLDGMKAGSRHGVPVRKLPDAERTMDNSGTFPTWKMHVVDEASGRSSNLIINRPFAGHSTVAGRSTRAYLAFDLNENRLIFLKDSWREDNAMLRAEYKTYQLLHANGVPHIPEILYGGDVLATGPSVGSQVQDHFCPNSQCLAVRHHISSAEKQAMPIKSLIVSRRRPRLPRSLGCQRY